MSHLSHLQGHRTVVLKTNFQTFGESFTVSMSTLVTHKTGENYKKFEII